MTPLDRTRIEKAAADCGFDLPAELEGHSLLLRSTKFPEIVELQPMKDNRFGVRACDSVLLEGLPCGEEGWMLADGVTALYEILERAASTARTMPSRIDLPPPSHTSVK